MTMIYFCIFLQIYSTKRQLAIVLCTAGGNNYELNYTASRLQELAG